MTTQLAQMSVPSVFGGDIFSRFFDVVNGSRDFDSWGPEPYDVMINKDGDTVLEFSLVGFDKKDIKVFVKGQTLYVDAQKSSNDDEYEFVHRKIARRSVKKQFSLRDSVDKDKITSEYSNGVLRVIVPINKSEKKERIIKIN